MSGRGNRGRPLRIGTEAASPSVDHDLRIHLGLLDLAGRVADETCADRHILLDYCTIDMMSVDAMAPCMFHQRRAVGHGVLDIDRLARRIPRKRDLPVTKSVGFACNSTATGEAITDANAL